MNSQRLALFLSIGVLSLLFVWGVWTARWRRSRLAALGVALFVALLLLSRRVSLFELLLVGALPAVLFVLTRFRGR